MQYCRISQQPVSACMSESSRNYQSHSAKSECRTIRQTFVGSLSTRLPLAAGSIFDLLRAHRRLGLSRYVAAKLWKLIAYIA